jgi:hypothetical protein
MGHILSFPSARHSKSRAATIAAGAFADHYAPLRRIGAVAQKRPSCAAIVEEESGGNRIEERGVPIAKSNGVRDHQPSTNPSIKGIHHAK